MNRKTATDKDLKIGTIVYKSAKAPTAWKVVAVSFVPEWHGDERVEVTAYAIAKATSKGSKGCAAYSARFLWIEG